MSYRFQSDEPQKINIELHIQISFPLTFLTNNDAYFSEKRETSSVIINSLREMGITDYKLRYCLVIDGDFGPDTYRRDSHEKAFLVPGPTEWTEIGQFIMQITAHISKDDLDIAASLLSIITSLASLVLIVLQLGKMNKENKKSPPIIPTVTTTVDDEQRKIIGYEPKEPKELEKELKPLIKEQPVTSKERKVKIKGGYLDPQRSQPNKPRKPKKQH